MRGRLHPTDAQTYWMSAAIPNDQFLLYCFDTTATVDVVTGDLVRNARVVPDLNIRFRDGFGYPRTVSMRVAGHHIVPHSLPERDWQSCLHAAAGLVDRQLDPRRTPWALHLFDSITDAPRCSGPSLVAVLQISHALGDGRRVSSIARQLFGERSPDPAPSTRGPWFPGRLVIRSRRAQRLEQQLVADTAAGLVPAQAPGRPKTRVNVAPHGETSFRTVVRDHADLTGPNVTVTTGALTAISVALSSYLRLHGDDVSTELGAEVTLARSGERTARNHFRNAGIGLFPEVDDLATRARLISAALAERRLRADHPAMAAQSLASEAVPGVLLRWGIRRFDPTAIPETVTGNTVVSSVNRGSADLSLGGGRVAFTAGFPALSPVMSLTHGVHGIGDAVTIGITSSASAVADPDVYAALMHDAVDDVAAALH